MLASLALAAALLAALALAAPVVIGSSSAAAQGGLVRIGAVPQLPHGVRDLGAAPAGAAVAGAVVLRPRDPAALESFIAAATSKGSPAFGRYLGRGEFAARFGPSGATISAVKTQLGRAGLRVGAVSGDGLLVRFSGPAGRVAGAFATGIHDYRLAGGEIARATTSAPALPQAIARSVAAVVGLDDVVRFRPLRVRRPAGLAGRFPAAKATKFAHPPGSPDACRAARADAVQFGGLTDDQIAYAYGAFGLYGVGDTGSGVHIGVFEEEPFLTSDLEHFDTCYFGAAGAASMLSRLHVISLEGGQPEGPGSDGEALLDVEDVSAMAPGADIDVYENAETPGEEVAEIAAMVDEDRDQIITSSYGQPCEQEEETGQPGTQQALDFLFQQAAAQGQTFLGAAGDNGSDSCEEVHRETSPQPGQNPISTGEIASQPYVLGVGGTTITDATQPVQEHVWNDGDEGGAGGGGISQSFAAPSWQRDATVPGIALPGGVDYTNAASVERRFGYPTGFCEDTLADSRASTPCRLEPDVSAQSDEFTGAITVYSEEYRGEGEEMAPDGWVTSGGTSSGAPIWAGMLALADASPTCRSNPSTASGVGFVSPLLYAIASNPSAYAASFNDITEGDNDQYGLDDGGVFPARPGFDLASGLGSPRMTGPGGSAGLAYYLCSYSARGVAPSVSGLDPSSGTTSGGESVTVSGSGFQSAGASDVAGVQVGVWHVPANAIHVLAPGSLTITLPPARDTLPADTPAPEDGAGPADVIVTLSDDQSSSPGPGSTFQYVDTSGAGSLPSVTGVTPAGGSETAPGPVTILGSGFAGARGVSFGGVSASSYAVLGDSEIRVTPPPYSAAHTVCASLPTSGVYAGEDASNDLCQAQVVVHGAHGASASARILPPFEGAPSYEQDGALVAPPGCGCEVYPAVTEFDYAPAPTITSVSTSSGPAALASETGETLVTVHGAGLNRFTFDYADFGEPGLESSIDLQPAAFDSGTELQIPAPTIAESVKEASTDPISVPFSVRTLAGSSTQTPVEYAGVPRVSGVQSTASEIRLEGRSGAPDTGGTPIAITGKGMIGQVTLVRFSDSASPPSEGTNYTFVASSDKRLSTQTVSQNPALANVQACTVTGCSPTSRADLLYIYPPGQPQVLSLAPGSGSPAGGTHVAIHGQNLGCPLAVAFGENPAESFSSAPESTLACPSATLLEAVSPPGAAGSKVTVHVTTLESLFTDSGDAPTTAGFTYTGSG
ncbi:MAG TPA: protease pro-enzyme activation domain-containing protein [Solirubrobacteraceae bacterium]|nr:protease pro-enzyme activation domain-containing protein [Solirubrobacteraceae bacterium]